MNLFWQRESQKASARAQAAVAARHVWNASPLRSRGTYDEPEL
jgi:hypothetical protein